jgi:predicted metal-binding protein
MESIDSGHGSGHGIIVCIRCRGPRTVDGGPGIRLISLLHALFDGTLTSNFHLAEAHCMAGCGRPLTVAYTAPGKASHLFGGVDPDRDAPHLIDFARLYQILPDGWCREGERPPGLVGKTLARIPATLTAGGAR